MVCPFIVLEQIGLTGAKCLIVNVDTYINWDQIAKVVQLCANVKAREISGTSRENGYYAAGHEGFTSKPALSGICDSAAAPFSCSCIPSGLAVPEK